MTWTWNWHPHPDVWVVCTVLLVAYFTALTVLGPRHNAEGQPDATPGQIRNFCLGVLALLVAAEWPIHDLAERALYSVHMIQHLILTMAVAPMLLTGLPPWLVRALLPPRLMRIARALTRPLVALVIFNATLVFTHWPTMVDASVHNEWSHFFLHTLLVVTAMIMWTPVLSPVMELPRLSYPGQMMYLFLQSLVPTVPASFLTFGSRPLYHVYETFPRIAHISALGDQRVAGLVMKIVGGLILWIVIINIFFKWHALETRDGVDVLEHRDIERTLNRVELTN